MRFTFFQGFFVAAVLLFSGPRAPAQSIATGHSYAGVDLGITGTTLFGNQNFLWRLDPTDPTLRTYLPFSQLGSGIGFIAGGKIGLAATDFLDIETKLRFQTNHTSREESFTNLILDPYKDTLRGDGVSRYSLTQSSADLGIFGHLRLSNTLYVIAGADYATFLNNTLTLHQDLRSGNQPYYIRTNTHTQSFIDTLDRPASELLNYLVEVRGSAQIGMGSVFRLGTSNNLLLDAELLVSIPFTDWMSNLGKAHLNSEATYFEQPAITYPRMWYASLTFGLRFPFEPLPPVGKDEGTLNISPPSSLVIHPSSLSDSTGAIILSGTVTNAKTGKPVDATMTAVDLSTNTVVSTGHADSLGNYSIKVFGPGKYSVTADAPGYLFGSAYFEVDAQGRILKDHADIKLSETSSGRTRLLVFFEFGKADLQPASVPELDRAVHLMKAVPAMQVEIAGYTDSVGTREYNKELSERRANAVRDYLIANGVANDRVVARGYGSDSPIAPNATDEGRGENRRVEFIVEPGLR